MLRHRATADILSDATPFGTLQVPEGPVADDLVRRLRALGGLHSLEEALAILARSGA